MFSKVEIEAYRGLENVILDNLSEVNILIGDNNCGKTSVLEAIRILGQADTPSNVINIARNREDPIEGRELMPFDLFQYSFPIDMEFKNIVIKGTGNKPEYNCSSRIDMLYGFKNYVPEEYEFPDKILSSRRKKPLPGDRIRYVSCDWSYFGLQNAGGQFYMDELLAKGDYKGDEFSIPKEAFINMNYISPIDTYTNNAIENSLYQGMTQKERNALLDLLRIFDSSIEGIDVSYRYTEPMTKIDITGNGLVPISIFGDGLKKVLSIASVLMKSKDGILLIDEIDSSLHPEIMPQVASWLVRAAKMNNVQLFITTHSKDAMDALVNASDIKDCIRAYRLDHYENKIYVRIFDGIQLQNWSVKGGASVL